VLRELPESRDPRVLVGAATSDDAAVFALDADTALVQTLDFFTPVVDDAYDFGRVAAANALSDLYAMNAEPLFALNIVGFPAQKLPLELLGAILRGGADVAAQAGIEILGGHSIDDPEPKYGLVATGRVRRDAVWTNAGARPGDVLVLTKPLVSGIFTTALKRDLLPPERAADVVALMATLNRDAARAAQATATPHACTDITGFGLIGHLHAMLRESGAGAELDAAAVPYVDEVLALADAGCVPGGTRANRDTFAGQVDFGATSAAEQWVLCDAQTSGGLLFAVPESQAGGLVAALQAARTGSHAVIGRVVAAPPARPGGIVVRGRLGAGAVQWR
jgi:selenide,water dikinase